MKKNGEYRNCLICNISFYAKRNQILLGKAKYCSYKCMGVSNIGKTPWNKGKHPEYIQGKNHPMWKGGKIEKECNNCGKKMLMWRYLKDGNRYCSESCRSTFVFKRDGGNMKGKKQSIEAKNKISKYQLENPRPKEFFKLNGLKGSKTLYKRQPTSIEVKLYDELKRRGLLFESQHIVNGKFCVDAYISSLNLIIEADGGYWHKLERIQKKDKAENAYLTKCGYKLLRLSEEEINDGSFINKLN